MPSPSGETSCLNNGNSHDGNKDLNTRTCQRTPQKTSTKQESSISMRRNTLYRSALRFFTRAVLHEKTLGNVDESVVTRLGRIPANLLHTFIISIARRITYSFFTTYIAIRICELLSSLLGLRTTYLRHFSSENIQEKVVQRSRRVRNKFLLRLQ